MIKKLSNVIDVSELIFLELPNGLHYLTKRDEHGNIEGTRPFDVIYTNRIYKNYDKKDSKCNRRMDEQISQSSSS